MLDLFKSLRRGALVVAAGAGLALSATAVAHAGGHHHHKGHHHHGHHHHGHHHHHFWRFRHLYTGGYGYCSYWRNTCASRWGFGSNAYGRCLWRHGC